MKSWGSFFFISLLQKAFAFFALLLLASVLLPAQQPGPNSTESQRSAMQKLAFLSGRWSGPVTITRGPGEPLRVMQTEDVQYKLDGMVMLVEGKSTDETGKIRFSALATISYDDSAHAYRFRAYNDGHYIDTELTVADNGFSWAFDAGPAHIVNTMHLTDKGEWKEVTEASVNGGPQRRSVEMLLQHQR